MLNLYKISFNSLIVALVALQQSYAVQSIDIIHWDKILQEAYYAYYDTDNITEDEAIVLLENIQLRNSNIADLYATIQFSKSEFEYPSLISNKILAALPSYNFWVSLESSTIPTIPSTFGIVAYTDRRAQIAALNMQLKI